MKMKEYVFTTTGPFDEDKFLEGELAAFLQNYDKEYDDDAVVSDVAIHFYELGKKMKQKPAELSEEDEKNIEKLDGFLSEVFCYGHVYISQKDKEELQNWLKSLRP